MQSEYHSDCGDIFVGDAVRIGQIISNLLGNAVKFTEKGSIRVGVQIHATDKEQATAIVSVEDTGIGIQKDRLEHIFEAFEQEDTSTSRKFGGTGLGLSISKKLAQLMGGELDADSEFGKGSVFTLTLSLKIGIDELRKEKEPEPETKEDTAVVPVGLKILLAEDNKVNQKVAIKFFKKAGCEITVVEDGILALEEFDRRDYDIVFLDTHMPKMDGLETAKEIRKRGSKGAAVPVISMSADVIEENRMRCLQSGMNAFLSKPLRYDELSSLLATYATKK